MESSGHKLIEQVVYAIVTHPMRQGQEKPNTMLWRERIFKKDWVITLLSRISRHRIISLPPSTSISGASNWVPTISAFVLESPTVFLLLFIQWLVYSDSFNCTGKEVLHKWLISILLQVELRLMAYQRHFKSVVDWK